MNKPPINAIIVVAGDENPHAMYPGTTWEIVENNIYFITTKELSYDKNGAPNVPYIRPVTWKRIS